MSTTSGTPTSPSSLIVTEARSWNELEIYLNKPWMVALPSLPRVSSFLLDLRLHAVQGIFHYMIS